MGVFEDLGQRVERLWRESGFSSSQFPAIASTELANFRVSDESSIWDPLRTLLADRSLPVQEDIAGQFSDLPLTVYRGSRFYVAVLHWLDGTTDIHQHSFAGAFRVLSGSSLHCTYSFSPAEEVNEHLLYGELALENCELLRVGDVRQILAGSSFIHSLFHLDRPSTTVVIRTYQDLRAFPQYSYSYPGLATNPFFASDLHLRTRQAMSLLQGLADPTAERLLEELFDHADLHTKFHLLDSLSQPSGHSSLESTHAIDRRLATRRRLIETAKRRHGPAVDVVVDTCNERQWLRNGIRARRLVTEPEHRFFLALLLNLKRQADILTMTRLRFPEKSPSSLIVEWIDDLARSRVGLRGETNALGFEVDDECLANIEQLLQGNHAPELAHRSDSVAVSPAVTGSILRPLFLT